MCIDIHGWKRPQQEEPVEVAQACQDATWTPPWGKRSRWWPAWLACEYLGSLHESWWTWLRGQRAVWVSLLGTLSLWPRAGQLEEYMVHDTRYFLLLILGYITKNYYKWVRFIGPENTRGTVIARQRYILSKQILVLHLFSLVCFLYFISRYFTEMQQCPLQSCRPLSSMVTSKPGFSRHAGFRKVKKGFFIQSESLRMLPFRLNTTDRFK